MPSLTLKNIPPPLLERLRVRASHDRRSLNREAIWLLEQVLDGSSRAELDSAIGSGTGSASDLGVERDAQLAAWQSLAGRWQGTNGEVDGLIDDIYQARTQGRDIVL
jgi:plasmid stability protein